MALNTQIADATVNAQANALAALCNSGFIKLYDGTMPASADTALSGNTLGATLTFGATAFQNAVSGTLVANAVTPGTAVASITPTFARVFRSDGITVVMDLSCGSSGANITIGAFTAGTSISVASFTHDVRNATTGF
ncbi:hypothetical protein B9Z51_08645 [Limnohabitans sp. T6-5]|uniref:hypothetical protein n=1 Tax=Limnohabitans sp. T6-5 TaxID=1100724 RepID=UPI000D36F7C6|nr:hypothetical protein [Limnohabitans sp. T6-5]PUE08992.1 hypothetical protein B9Z51_08645 [Limnohabitans sp. T6-5]